MLSQEQHRLDLLDGVGNMAKQHGSNFVATLPIMARKPPYQPHLTKIGWPLLEHLGLCRKPIAPDGNCLFRALADQLYDNQDRHAEIRAKTIAHIRGNREEFEGNTIVLYQEGLESSQTKTRGQARQKATEDLFDEYCSQKEKSGTWGEEPEIVAFTEAFDRDVLIYRPFGQGLPVSFYHNRKRDGSGVKYVQLAFGGEDVKPHYESVRPVESRVGRTPAAATSSKGQTEELFSEAKLSLTPSHNNSGPLEKLRKARPSLSTEELINFIDGCRNQLDDRCAGLIHHDRERSSSHNGSRRGSSSKRSREDVESDSEPLAKRASRGASLRPRTRAFVSTSSEGTELSFRVRLDSPSPTSADGRGATPDRSESATEGIAESIGKGKVKPKVAKTAAKKGKIRQSNKTTTRAQ